jgi:hypothetical protein
MRVVSFLLCLLALAVAAGGCSDLGPAGGLCAESCDPGEVCDPTTGQCLPVVKTTPALEVVPPTGNNRGWVVQEFPKPPVGPDGRIAIKLQPAISLEGGVYASHDLTKVVPAQVIAWRASELEGMPTVQSEVTTGSRRDASDPNSTDNYLLWLSPGHTYSFYVTPLPPYDAEYPPLVVPGFKLTDHLKKDFVLDGKDRAVLVKGQVVDSTGSAFFSPTPPRNEKGVTLDFKVQVRAYETDGSRKSTLGITDPEKGEFSFAVPAGVSTYTIRVETTAGGVPIPKLECSNIVLGLASQSQQTGQPTQEINPIRLPSFQIPKLYTVNVRGKDGTKEGAPVKGAAVTFAALDLVVAANDGFDSCNASYSRTGYTDANGKVDLLLLPGAGKTNQIYSVTVVSPATSPFASQWIKSFEVGPNDGILADIMLEPRHEVSGTVVRQDTDAPVAGVTIEARGVATGSSTAKVPTTTASATTDAEGRYQLFVDPGFYNLDLRPPQDSGLPSLGMTTKIEGDVLGKVFTLPLPKVVVGRVLDPDGTPLLSAKVQMYELVPEIEKPLTQKATLRASAVTDADGAFGLLVAEPAH